MYLLLAVLCGVFLSEAKGYLVHRLIHSGRVQWLENNHMDHHLDKYPPGQAQRFPMYLAPDKYKRVLGIGTEWFTPIVLVAVPLLILLAVAGVALLHLAGGVLGALVWAKVAFDYCHDQMHLSKSWLRKYKWFKSRRRLHDIHHHRVDTEGKMDANFGIMWYGLDRLFKTYRLKT